MIALIVGHSKKSRGASNKNGGETEFEFNNNFVKSLSELLVVENTVVYRDTYKGLPDKVNELNPSNIISFHCNAFNTRASGSEVLYYNSSVKGKAMASILQTNIVKVLGLSDRGIKAKHSEDRGGYLLKYTKAPCIIVEPFFIDNDKDLQAANDSYTELLNAYINSINEIIAI